MLPRSFVRVVASASIIATISGCNGTNDGSATSSGPSSTAPPASSSAVTSSGAIGVPECDQYVARMRACVEGAPESERAQRKGVVDQIESTWKQQALVADTKSRLPATCKASLEALDNDAACKK